ncbi:hypothetical protein BIW11_00260 [Tropilaelaps mercedesae]|uniref:Uncharacterized protein n=1 Tax=Tropilaelaps mercedesae TaxID=418985 RepID=A0A1V9XYX2_9ACAR|nr:hypothetical protein BIW11_00260 [Tropilaelaps mercedesae]
MLCRSVLCALALAVFASANGTVNNFIDNVLYDMSLQVPRNGLDPLRVVPFQVKVKGNGITNRDFKANFTQGSIFGLSGVTRQGDCTYGTFQGLMKMGCYVTFRFVKIIMNADVKGDQISGTKHAISTSTAVMPNTLALVEIQGHRGGPAGLANIIVNAITMNTTVVQGKLDLKSSRYQEFIKQTHTQLSNQLHGIVHGTYAAALRTVLSRRFMP